jgi:hypothetical protein
MQLGTPPSEGEAVGTTVAARWLFMYQSADSTFVLRVNTLDCTEFGDLKKS